MADLKKVRVQLLDTETNGVIEDVDVLTSASSVTFTDGKTLQEKANEGSFGYDDTEIRNELKNKANKATTLSGYGIDDAYTKTEVDAKVTSVYKYKGSKANKAALPSSGNVVGDVWNLEDTGMNVAWTGTSWDDLGVNIDLTPYLTKTEASTTYASKTHTHTKSQITDFPTTMKNPTAVKIQLNSGTTEGTNQFTYDGSAAKNINITPTLIGAAASSHTHAASQVTQDSTHRFVTDTEKAKLGKLENIKYGADTTSGKEVKLFLKVVE